MSDDPRYVGRSDVVHIDEDDTETSVVPVGPELLEPRYEGRSPTIITRPWSPDQFHLESLPYPPMEAAAYYRGRSKAIHVRGTGLPVWPPVLPLTPCDYPYNSKKGVLQIGWDLNSPLSGGPPQGSKTLEWTVNGLEYEISGSLSVGMPQPLNDPSYDFHNDFTSDATRVSVKSIGPLGGGDLIPEPPGLVPWRHIVGWTDADYSDEPGNFNGGVGPPSSRVYGRVFHRSGFFIGLYATIFFRYQRMSDGTRRIKQWLSYVTPNGLYYNKWLFLPVASHPLSYNAGVVEPTAWQTMNGPNPFWQFIQTETFEFRFTKGQVNIGGLIPVYATLALSIGSTSSGLPTCTDLSDAPLPSFTPGYLPIFRRQIGDPTTSLDRFMCVMESAAMVLDWHTRGATQVWGGELLAHTGVSEAQVIANGGTTLQMARNAWAFYGQNLEIRAGSWTDFLRALGEGRAIVLITDYGEISPSERCQTSFEGNHAVSVYPYDAGTKLLTGDPLCSGYKGYEADTLQRAAEAYGRASYGTGSPQRISFAVSRPWVP